MKLSRPDPPLTLPLKTDDTEPNLYFIKVMML